MNRLNHHNTNRTTDRKAGVRCGLALVLAAALTVTLSVAPGVAKADVLTAADIVFVVDESGAPTDVDFAWVKTAAAAIETKLAGEGFTSVQFGLVGFGSFMVHYGGTHHDAAYSVGGGSFGTAAQFATAVDANLVQAGVDEDGYLGIETAVSLFSRPDAARLIVLVTDEGRDTLTDPEHAVALTFDNVLDALTGAGVTLNVVVDLGPDSDDRLLTIGAQPAIALTGDEGGADTAYTADGAGGFNTSVGGSANGLSDVVQDYVELAWATQGAAFDLDFTNSADAMTVASITAALAHIKHLETNNPGPPPVPPQVPEPATFWAGLALLVLAWGRQRRICTGT